MENLTKVIQWAQDSLLEKGYSIGSSPEIIQQMPYSNVLRFDISIDDVDRSIYLKQVPAAFGLESQITQFLHDQLQVSVPEVIDANQELNCFLMKDAGILLREALKQNFQADLVYLGIKEYLNIQFKLVDNVDYFLKLGVPDWRLEKLPGLYNQIIQAEEMLIQDGLTKQELNALQALYSTFSSICELLSNFQIPERLDHCDFHDNNVLIDPITQKINIIDWGETVVTHPFFSLISYLSFAAYRYNSKGAEKMFIDIMQKILIDLEKGYKIYSPLLSISEKDLLSALLLAKKIWPIYSALGYYRLIKSSDLNLDKEELQSFFFKGRNKGRLAGYFKGFIKINLNVAPENYLQVDLFDLCRDNLVK